MTTRALDAGNSAGNSAASMHRDRLRRAAVEAAERGLDALLITPSPDYAYLLGYRAPAMERLTCLVVPADGQPVLVLPRLEEPLARHGLGELADELEIVAWDETDDPIRAVQVLVGSALRVGVQDQMWARFALRLQAALDPAQMVAAGATLSSLRRVKSVGEIDLLRAAASAADQAMLGITAERLSGRTEAEVSRRIRELLIEAGHDDVGFAIVASGPNSASPHHEAGDRVIGTGDAIVLACTHFPLVEAELAAAAPRRIAFIDGSRGIARRTAWLMRDHGWREAPGEGIAVFTGPAERAEAYRPGLAAFGLTRIESL